MAAATPSDDENKSDESGEKSGSIWGKISGGLKQLTGGGK